MTVSNTVGIVFEARWLLLEGIRNTLITFFCSAFCALLLALLLGLARTSRSVLARWAATCWVEFFRGISTVVLLFWLYYVFPMMGVALSALAAAVIGLSLVHGAYGSEIVRGAVQAIGPGQHEAAAALGLSRWATVRSVILPQAFAICLPSMGNSLVLLMKGTSIAALISLHELTYQSNLVVTRTYAIFSVFFTVLLIYYAMSICCVSLTRSMERRVGRWRPVGDAQ